MNFRTWLGLAVMCLLAVPAMAQQPAAALVRVRGEIAKIEGDMMTVKTRGGMVDLKLSEKVGVTGVKKADFSEVTKDKFVGITSIPQPDGSLKAVEVHIFPESLRGRGEGHREWDLEPNSKMTNANISAAVESTNGRELTMSYKDGKQKILVPPGVPIVTFVPGERSMLVPGAKVFVIAVKNPDGSLTAERVNAGIDTTPPM